MKSCGLIKDLKTRYSIGSTQYGLLGCGLIKDLKTRYSTKQTKWTPAVVVWLKIWKHDIH